MSTPIKLIVGLGNPGSEYEKTRHNAGRWLVDQLLEQAGVSFSNQPKFHALTARIYWKEQDCYVLFPTTFMNLSGQAVVPFARYHQIPAQSILVIHDELDLPIGTIRLKKGGGPGGHKGLQSIMEQMGSRDFTRLRIGIGHPGSSDQVTSHVLNKPSLDEKIEIHRSIDRALEILPDVLSGSLSKAMQILHSQV